MNNCNVIGLPIRPKNTPLIDELVRSCCVQFNRARLPSVPPEAVSCRYPRCPCMFGSMAVEMLRLTMPQELPEWLATHYRKTLAERFPDLPVIIDSDIRALYLNDLYRELWK